jgi:NADH dehydrogenase [ubiquinone] 1 alpha subcomplex assembly factor 7
MTALAAEIRRMIAVDGPLPVARFMALCLGHPRYGYYATRDPFGAGGDFITAPEISQMFGELIGLWAAEIWRRMGTPRCVGLVELGPGRGTLMADALRAAKVVPAFRAALSVHLIETSPALRARQAAVLETLDLPLAWYHDVSELPEIPLVVIANEFFDALPVHQAVRAADGWHERVIAMDAEDNLSFAVHPDPIGDFHAVLPLALREVPIGSLYEWRSSHPTAELARCVVRSGGTALVIDYGHVESTPGETLQAVSRHGFVDPLRAPGQVDLTAHVDFAALARAALGAGACVHGPVPQGAFLRRLGIEARATVLKQRATPAQAAEIDAAVRRLIAPGPDGMGELFKAVVIADPRLGPLVPGFES